MNKVKKTTLWGRLRNAARAFKDKPVGSISFDVEVKRCSECERKKPERAQWIEGDYGESLKLACSSCGSPFEYRTTFCPDCGAKMEA